MVPQTSLPNVMFLNGSGSLLHFRVSFNNPATFWAFRFYAQAKDLVEIDNDNSIPITAGGMETLLDVFKGSPGYEIPAAMSEITLIERGELLVRHGVANVMMLHDRACFMIELCRLLLLSLVEMCIETVQFVVGRVWGQK